jgi:hypothetical protein
MILHLFTIEEKIDAIEAELKWSRSARREPGSREQRHHELLKAIAADLRARQTLPRNNALGDLSRTLEKMKSSKTALGYEQGKMIEVANVVVSKWPVISQALELFGEESAE